MIVRESCSLGSVRMQLRPTHRIDAAGSLGRDHGGPGLARSRLAAKRTGNGIATSTR
jgi:hypothetical protein